jgi:hypothetical protein
MKSIRSERAHHRAHILLDALHSLTAAQCARVLAAISTLFGIENRRDRVAREKERAAHIKREHAALADQFRRDGEGNPRTLAWEKLAERAGCTVEALQKRVRRAMADPDKNKK